MRTYTVVAAVAASLSLSLSFAPEARAANKADLEVDLVTPAAVNVYDTSAYEVTVSNVGNRRAKNVALTIDLPETNTSPVVHIMGDLGALDPTCSQSGTSLTCSLGTIKRNKSVTVAFDIDFPQVDDTLEVSASATTTSNESNLGNNSDTDVPPLDNYDITVSAGDAAHNRHCTGQNLTSFYECELYPSSISSHDIVFQAAGVVSIVGQPDYTGAWSQPTSDSLEFSYSYNGQVVAEFIGFGSSPNCFEGITTFPNSSYVSPYQVCI